MTKYRSSHQIFVSSTAALLMLQMHIGFKQMTVKKTTASYQTATYSWI